MEAVISGWVAGYAMAILSTIAITFLAVKADLAAVTRWFPDMKPVLIAVPASIGTFMLWTIAGLGLGALYNLLDLESQAGFLGAPSGPFVAGLAVVAIMPLPFLVLVLRKYWWLWAAMSASFTALFGWLMPLMAQRW